MKQNFIQGFLDLLNVMPTSDLHQQAPILTCNKISQNRLYNETPMALIPCKNLLKAKSRNQDLEAQEIAQERQI
jgi:hypothetical protein